jgi:ribose transport system substrate-binding protein
MTRKERGASYRSGRLDAREVRIGVAMPAPDQEWTAGSLWYARRAIADWTIRDPGIRFDLRSDSTVEEQARSVGELVDSGIDCLVILPIESAGVTPIVRRARREGVFVVDTDRGLLDDEHDAYVTGDNYQYGSVAAEWMSSELKGRGKIVAISGVPCTIDALRMRGFHDGIAHSPGIRILGEQVGYWNKGKSRAIMESFLNKFPQIDGVYSQDDGVQEAVLLAYRESGRSDISVFFGGTGQRSTIRKILDGDEMVRATVSYTPSLIATSISFGALASRGMNFDGFYQNKVPSKVIMRSELITRENASEYYVADSVF